MSRPISNRNASLFIGLWLGLTVFAGAGVFALFYWASSGGDNAVVATPLAEVTTSAPTAHVIQPTTALPASPTGSEPAADVCSYPPLPPSGFGYGIQVHAIIAGIDNTDAMDAVRYKLHLPWVKLQVRWSDIEPQPGDLQWVFMDNAIEKACEKGLRVMLSIVTAPTWTQANPLPAPEGQAAPPDDFNVYANFLGQVIDRYRGRIEAIEVWNEANLEREWNSPGGVSAAEFARMMQVAYTAIKARDPEIIVIAGAPAPTGINCNVGPFPANCQPTGRPIIVDDATFLKQFVAAGGLNYADCIGTHANGTNLPPTTDAYNPPDQTGFTFTGPWTNPHYSWSLRSQIETYAMILEGSNKKQCLTEFGFASPMDGKYPVGYEFAADVTEQQQAEYIVQAFNWMRDSGHVQMAFLFNFDYAPKGGDPGEDDNVNFAIVNKAGIPRPAFDAISLMPLP
jgi:hypothetical protein